MERTSRNWAVSVAAIGIAVGLAAACASGGGSALLSKTTLSSEDLARAQYHTVYDLLRAHSRAKIISFQGQEFLTVYDRGDNIRSGEVTAGEMDLSRPGQSSEETSDAGARTAAQITGTGPAEPSGEALLILNEDEVQGNVTQILQQMELSEVAELRILRPSETSARYGGDGYVGSVVIYTEDARGSRAQGG